MSKTSGLFKSVGDTIITGACEIKMGTIDRGDELVQRMVGWVGQSTDSPCTGVGNGGRLRQ